jgi:hypothetical protein
MAAAPIKPEYGPTLGRLLSARWRSAPPSLRVAAIVSSVLLLALAIVAVDRLLNRSFSHAGQVPFSFNYRGLHRVTPDPGGYVKVERRGADGRLEASFAVEPLRLPAYSGVPAGELPLYAAGYIRALQARLPQFVLRAEGDLHATGTIKITGPGGYNIFYSALIEGRKMYGRDELVVPERPGAREGVEIVMLSAPAAGSHGTSPLEVATKSDVLARPLRTFTLG